VSVTDHEPTLADVAREFPKWECWRAVSGLLYARPRNSERDSAQLVRGEDPYDLRNEIIHAEARDEL
jgi:hypothetical protein